MNKKYEFLEHTADTKIKAYGKTLEEAFENTILATTQVMTDAEKIEPTQTKQIKIKAKNTKTLLYDLLEEIIILLDVDAFITKTAKIKIQKKQEQYDLEAQLIGDEIKKEYEFHSIIKAITYSEMEITQKEEEYIIQIVHDL